MSEETRDREINILVVDDHAVVRHGIKLFLETIEGFNVIGDAGSGEVAIEICQQRKPDVVLMDLVMPEMDGVEALRAIKAIDPSIHIVILTSFPDDIWVQRALQSGAIGYLLKTASTDEIEQSIRMAYDGKPMLSREATDSLLKAARSGIPSTRFQGLTNREMEVLNHMAAGLTNRQIAEKIELSRSTVKFHVSSVLAKLGVSSRTEAVALALQEGIITLK